MQVIVDESVEQCGAVSFDKIIRSEATNNLSAIIAAESVRPAQDGGDDDGEDDMFMVGIQIADEQDDSAHSQLNKSSSNGSCGATELSGMHLAPNAVEDT